MSLLPGLPVNYRKAGDPVIASYNWVDVADGTGIVKFYGLTSQTTPSILNTSAIASKTIETQGAPPAGASYGLVVDLTFDTNVLSSPRTLKGTAVFNVAGGMYKIGGGDVSYYPAIRVCKWDGTTETQITSASGAVVALHAAATYEKAANDNTIQVTIPETDFKVGESIRIVSQFYGIGNGSIPLAMGHSPQNYDTTNAVGGIITIGIYAGQPQVQKCNYTNFIAYLPFKIMD